MLADIINAAMTRLNTGRQLRLDTLMGEKHIMAVGVPPRVVWVPTDDSFGPTENLGAQPRQVYTRIAGVGVHIWGPDLAQTEKLLNDLVAAIRQTVTGPNVNLESATWITEGELMALGAVCVLRAAFKIPITEAPLTTTTIVAAPLTIGNT